MRGGQRLHIRSGTCNTDVSPGRRNNVNRDHRKANSNHDGDSNPATGHHCG
jgi:hypothetical protein